MVKIRHTDEKTRLRDKKVLVMATKFGDAVGVKLYELVREKKLEWDNPDPKNLLALRKMVVEYIKSGMYERKDMETEIGSVLAVLWFNRLEAELRERILNEWD